MNKTGRDIMVRNSAVTMACQFVHLLMNFVGRTILSKTLGTEYLGINGLFSNVLLILSFAELGLGVTLVYRLYEPIAKKDEEKIAAYVRLYKSIYKWIILIIISVGMLIIPFLKFIVKAPDVKENIVILYMLYLVDTVISYMFVYKKSVLIADQKSYIVSIITEITNIVMNIIQCIVLVVLRDFIIYFGIRIVCNLLSNIISSIYTTQRYPYIDNEKGVVTKEEIIGLKNDVKGLLLTKIASTAFSGTDNIFISAFIGLKYVGILSNYTLILSTVNGIMSNVLASVTASLGNLNVTGNKEKTEIILGRIFFINTAIYGYVCLGMTILVRTFVTEIWLDKEYYLSDAIIIVAIIELFLRSIHYPIYTVRNSMGLFSQYKICFALAAVLNIILDFILVNPMGIMGLYVSTIICRGITYVIDIYVVYKNGFQKSAYNYVVQLIKWSVFLAVIYILLRMIAGYIPFSGASYFLINGLILTMIFPVALFMTFRKTDDIQFVFAELRKNNRRK